MTNEQSNYLCKFCFHEQENHGVYDGVQGGWIFDDNVEHEVWDEQQYSRLVCYVCNDDCTFEPMTNLEYLEHLYEIRNSNT